jgi:outer membrane protein assembly factor BamA/autotransporter translocation and assembly factor TamB
MGRVPRLALRAAGIALLALLAVLLVLHLPPTRRAVASWAADRASRALDARVTIGDLSYNLPRLRVHARDVRLAPTAPGASPWFEAPEVLVDLPWGAIGTKLRFEAIELTRPRLDLEALETWLDARPKRDGRRLGRLDIDRLAIRELSLAGYGASAPFSVEIDRFSTEGASVGGTFTAPLEARGGTLRIGPYRTALRSIDGTMGFDGQQLALRQLRVLTADHEVEATGEVGLLGPSPAWALDVELSGEVGPVIAAWPDVPAARGEARVRGRVTGPLGSPEVALEASAADLGFAGVDARDAKVTAVVARGGLTLQQASFTALGGRIEGKLDLPSGTRAADRATVAWQGINLGALLGAVGSPLRASARSDGSATLDGVLSDRRTWTLDAASRLVPASGAPAGVRGEPRLSLRRGSWSLRMQDGALGGTRLSVDLRGQLPAAGNLVVGRSTLAGTASVGSDDVAETLSWLAQAGVDLPSGARDLVSGPVALDLALGGTVAAPSVTTQLTGQTLQVRGLGPVTLEGPVTVADGRTIRSDDLSATVAGGRFHVSGSAGFPGPLSLDIEATDLALAPLGRLLGSSQWLPSSGYLSAKGRIAGTARAPQATLDVRARDLEWLGQRIDSVSGPVAIAGRSVSSARLDVRAGEGRATIGGTVDVARETLDATLSAKTFPLRPLLLPPSASTAGGSHGESRAPEPIDLAGVADVSFAARGSFAAPSGSGRIAVTGLGLAGVRPGDAQADITLGGDGHAQVVVTVPTLAARATARTAIARPWNFEAVVDLDGTDLTRAAEVSGIDPSTSADLAGSISANLRATGRLDRVAESDVTLSLGRFEGVAFRLPVSLAAPAEVRVNAGEISTEGVEVETGSTRARLEGRLTGDASQGELRLRAEGAVTDLAPLIERFANAKASGAGRFTVEVAASGSRQAPRLTGSLDLRDGEVRLQDRPAITRASLVGSFRDGVVDIGTMRAEVGGGAIDARGTLPLHHLQQWLPSGVVAANPSSGPARLQGTIRDMAAGTLMSLAGKPPAGDIDVSFDATLDLAADRVDLDAIEGTVHIDRAAGKIRELSAAQVGTAEIRVGGGRASFEEWRWLGARTDLALRGTVGFTASPLTYDVELRGPIDLTALGAIVPGRTAGHIRVDLRVREVNGQPAVNGELFVSKGAWFDRNLQIALSDLSGSIRVQTNRLVIEGLRGRLNGGEVTASGTMSRAADGPGYSGTIALTGRRLAVEFPKSVVSEFDADVRLVSPGPSGTLFGIVGKSSVRPGPVRSSIRQLAMMFASGPPVLPTPDVERRRRLMATVGLDVQLDTTEDIVADSNDIRAQLGGSVRLTGTLASPGMLGKVDIRDDGELFLVGRVYKLMGGQIEFTEASRIEPRLNVRGETQVSDYQIELQLTGPVDRLDFRLRSNPPLGQGDLASLLTTGQTLKERREAATDEASDAARAQVLSAVSSEYLGTIGRWFGVDTVRIENSTRDLSAIDIDPVSRLTVAKNLGAFFEVVYSQSIETNDDIYWVIVYDPGWRKLEVSTKMTTQEGETVEVRQELLLGGGSRPTQSSQRSRRTRPQVRVTDVTVTGVPDTEAQDVAKRLKLSRGDHFDAYKWIRDQAHVERYYRERDRLRTTVDASRQPTEDGAGTALTYAVTRGGLTRLRVEGYEFDDTALLAMRTAWADSPIDEFVADSVSEAARLALAEDGYVQPTVKVDVRPAGEDAEAVVSVTPGPRSDRRTFSFTGNTTFASERLGALLTDAQLGAQPWVTPAVVIGSLEAYYGAAGFLNVQITPGTPRVDAGVATLPIAIDEGKQFKVATLQVDGARHVADAEVRTALGLDVGSVYTGLVSTDGVRRLTDLYGRRGHAAAKVTVDTTFDRAASTASLKVAVDEGIRQVVESVTTEGTDIATRQGMIDRSIKVEPGKPVDSATIEASQRRLYDLGTFMAVEPRFDPAGEPQKAEDGTITQPVKVVFGLAEYARYRLRYGFQVSTTALTTQGYDSGAAKPGVTVDLRRSNVFGTGVDAGIGTFLTTDRYRVRGLLSSATLGGRQIQNTLSATKDYQTATSSTYELTGSYLTISAEQRWRPRKRLEWAYGYNLEYQDIDVIVPIRGGESFDFLISARLASLFHYASYDTRDNLLNPTKGMFHSANVEVGTSWLASELGYASYLGQHFFFLPVGKFRLASAVRFGSVGILDAQEDSLEASLVRFRTGGGTTVRGYRQDDLSPAPIADVYYPGGDVLLVLNQEVRYTTWKWIELAAFVDAGNAFATFKDFSLGDLKLGVGTGLRLATPFGVIRLDVGFPRPRPDNYPLALWYFSFGQAF